MISYAVPRRFARATPEHLSALFDAVQKSPDDESIRHALADSLEESGRGHEAHFLRQYPDQSQVLRSGVLTGQHKVVPFHSEFFPVVHADNEDYDEPAQILDERGPEAAIEYLSQWDNEPDNYRFREGQSEPSWGSSDRTYTPARVSRVDKAGGTISNGRYHLYHNPRLGYIGLDYEHFEPHEDGVPDPSHTEFLEDGGRGGYKDIKHFADSEVGVPHSIVPYGSDWAIHTAPEHAGDTGQIPGLDDDNFDDKYNMSRMNYARSPEQDQQHETALLEAIQKNPEDESLYHAYADHLEEQGRHGEAAFMRTPSKSFNTSRLKFPDTGNLYYDVPFWDIYGHDMDFMTLTKGNQHHQKWMLRPDTLKVIKALSEQGAKPRNADPTQHPNYLKGDSEPVRHSAYRAPAGGTVVRGTYYVGGRLLPDLEGAFANPPQEAPAVQYPQPKQKTLKERLKAKFKRTDHLVVSYARATPETLTALMQAAHRNNQMGTPDEAVNHALADALMEASRAKEAELARGGRFQIDLNGGGKLKPRIPTRIRVDRNTRGLGYRELREQLDYGQTSQIGPNLVVRNAIPGGTDNANGDIHIHYHGNHVVTMHPNGDHTVFTRGWGHAPSTRAVIQRVTGHPLIQRRGDLFYGPQQVPFQEGSRFNNQGEPVEQNHPEPNTIGNLGMNDPRWAR